MIVFVASTIVGAAISLASVPGLSLRRAFETDILALSSPISAEYEDVLFRPRLAKYVKAAGRDTVLQGLRTLAVVFYPQITVADCRDAKDNKYLELALESGAAIIVSSDNDLLVLDPWRDVRILRPADYLAFTAPAPGR